MNYPIVFSKTVNDDYKLANYQDRITDNVWFTRLNVGGPLFNYKYYLNNNVDENDIEQAVKKNYRYDRISTYGLPEEYGTGGTYGVKWAILSDTGFTNTTYSNPDLFGTMGDPTNFFTFHELILLLTTMSIDEYHPLMSSKPIVLKPHGSSNSASFDPAVYLENGVPFNDLDIYPYLVVGKDLACYIPETNEYFKINFTYWGNGEDEEWGYVTYSRTVPSVYGPAPAPDTDPDQIVNIDTIGNKNINIDNISNTLNISRVLLTMENISENKNYLYFIANDGTHGEELWRTDKTDNVPTLVKDIRANSTLSINADNFCIMKDISENYLYFIANDGTNGSELWRTDGTNSGTTLVKNINVNGDSAPAYLTVMEDETGKNYLYFSADDGTNGIQLWKTDGTNSGTTLVTSKINDPRHLTVMEDATGKNFLYFRATDGTYGTELWRSDGTDSGTTLVKDINPSGNSSPDYLTVMKDAMGNNYLYFSADDGTHGEELWRTDGTTNGTTMVKNISVGTGSDGPSGNASKSSNPKHLTVMKDISEDKNYLYFNARSANPTIDYGEELWRTDGTESGTTMVKEIFVGYNNSDPRELTVMKDISENKNYLYFVAYGIYQYYEEEIISQIWRTDGTTTTLIQDIQPNEYPEPSRLTVMKDISENKNYLYFTSYAYIHGDYRDYTNGLLWRTDGTKTTLVQDQGINYYNYLFNGSSSDYYNYVREEPSDLTVMDDTSTNVLYFRAASDQNGNYNLFRLRITASVSISLKQNNAFIENLDTASLEKTELKTYLKSFYSDNKDSFNNKPVKLDKNTTLNGFTKPFPDKDIFLLDGTNPAKMHKDELVGEQFLVITEINVPVTLPTLMTDIEVKVTETSTDTFQVEKLSSNSTIETKTLSSGDSYTLEGLTITLGSIIGSLVEPVICFKEGTQILTLDLNTGLDTYKNIENINVGDLVSTYKHGYVPVNIIGYSNLINTSSDSRITDKMYVYKKEDHPELTEDLYMTGGHSVLVDYINNIQCEKTIEEMDKLYKTDDKFRLMAKLDYRCDTVDDNRQYRVWHICLDHENETMNYGIYANGMLVESTCERHAQNFLHKKENVVELIKDQCQLNALLV